MASNLKLLVGRLTSPVVIASVIISAGVVSYGWLTAKPRYELHDAGDKGVLFFRVFDNKTGKVYNCFAGGTVEAEDKHDTIRSCLDCANGVVIRGTAPYTTIKKSKVLDLE